MTTCKTCRPRRRYKKPKPPFTEPLVISDEYRAMVTQILQAKQRRELIEKLGYVSPND